MVLMVGSAAAEPVLTSRFGGSGDEAAAFVVAGGREVVTLGVAGTDLDRAALVGTSAAVSKTVADPVSRLVVFQSRGLASKGLNLASMAPAGGVLRGAGEGGEFRILGRTEEVGGRYLPFTLLRLSSEGAGPQPGTPLLDAGGRVVAVAHQAVNDEAFYALPVEVVRRVVEDARDGEVTKAWVGLILKPGSRSTRIERVVKGSPAETAGVRAGDVLREIAGKRVADYGDAVNAFFLLHPNRPVKVKVRRGAAEVMLELTPRPGGS